MCNTILWSTQQGMVNSQRTNLFDKPALDTSCQRHETDDGAGELKLWLKLCNFSVNKASFAAGQVRGPLQNT